MRVAYVRCSSIEQNEARQLEILKEYGIDKYFIEKASGKDMNREEFNKCLDYIREGDRLYIVDFSRLSRSLKDLLSTIEWIDRKGVELVSIKEKIDTSTSYGKLMLSLIGAINEFERQNIKERQAEGIEIAKRNKVYKGRQCKKYDEELLNKCLSGLADNTLSVSEVARKLGVTRPTVYNLLKRNNVSTTQYVKSEELEVAYE